MTAQESLAATVPAIGLRTLVDSGLLFELNRRVLHPVGMALALSWDGGTTDGEPDAVTLITTADPDGLVFGPDGIRDGSAKLQAFMDACGTSKVEARRAALGFIEENSMQDNSAVRVWSAPLSLTDKVRDLLAEHSPAEVLLAVASGIDNHAARCAPGPAYIESENSWPDKLRSDARAVRGVLGQLAETSSKAFK